MANIEVKKKIEELAIRAQQRRAAFPSAKSDNDAKEENTHFEELKFDVYKNIVRSSCK